MSMLNQILKYCLILLPFAIISGPFITNLLTVLGAISFLIISLIRNLKDYWLQPIMIYLIIFILYVTFLSFISGDFAHSFKSSISLTRIFIFVLAVQYIIEKKKDTLALLGYSLFISIIVISISIIFEYLNYLIIDKNNEENIFRFAGVLQDEKIGGYLIVHFYPIIISIAFFYKDKILNLFSKKILFSLFSLISLIAIILAGERTALFYLFVFISLSMSLLIKINIKTLFYFLLIITLPIIIIYISGLSDRYITQTLNEFQSNNQTNIISTKHNAFYQTSWKMFKHNYLLGIGPNMYRKLNRMDDYKDEVHENPSTHPHSMYLQLLAETGIIGFSFIFALFVYVSFIIIRQFINLHIFKKDYLRLDKVFLLILIFIALWPLAPSMNFFGSFNMIVLSLPVGIYLAKYNK